MILKNNCFQTSCVKQYYSLICFLKPSAQQKHKKDNKYADQPRFDAEIVCISWQNEQKEWQHLTNEQDVITFYASLERIHFSWAFCFIKKQ